MKYCNLIAWLTAVCALLALTACDPVSSAEFKIYNKTEDTVTVAMNRAIMSSPYEGFYIEENDSVTTHYGGDTTCIAVLAPDQVLRLERTWDGLYREEQIAPAWKYMEHIMIGSRELDESKWKNEAAWNLKTKGGGFGKGESRYYSLLLWTK